MQKQTKLAQRFDSLASHYDTFYTKWAGEYELQQIRPLVPEKSVVLDYGCGTGRTTIDLLQRGCSVTAYDFSPVMLSVAQTKAEKLGLQAEFTHDVQRLAGRTWPLITCIGVADYYPDPVILLKTLQAYLAPGGRIVITCPNAFGLLGKLYALGSRLSIPVYLQTPARMQTAAEETNLFLDSYRFAFPARKHLGLTSVFLLRSFHQPLLKHSVGVDY